MWYIKGPVRISIRPKSRLGKWSVSIAATGILLFLLVDFLWSAFSGTDWGRHPEFTVGVIRGIVCCIWSLAAFSTGFISIVKNKDLSILVLLATLIGLFFSVIFLLGLHAAYQYG